jgi:integrase/recombinase XerC
VEIKENVEGSYVLSFSLFGQDFKRTFKSFEEAYSFQENIKKTFSVSTVPIISAMEKYRLTISARKSQESKNLDVHILALLLDFLQKKGLPAKSPIGLVTYSMLESYQGYLLERGMKPASVNRHFSTIKNFFNSCEKWEYVAKSPARYVVALATVPVGKAVWFDETFLFVLNKLNGSDGNLLYFLRLTGARVSSAVRLKLDDIDLNTNQIALKSRKGPRAKEKIYYFPIHDALKKILIPLFDGKTLNDYAFLRQDNKPYVAKDYAHKVNKILRRSPQAINNGSKSLSLHGLRHSFASRMHERGMTANEVKALLGHASLRTTEGYIHSDSEQVLKKINKLW